MTDDLQERARATLLNGRDIYEVANQLDGYPDISTPADLADFLRREAVAATELANEIVRLRLAFASPTPEPSGAVVEALRPFAALAGYIELEHPDRYRAHDEVQIENWPYTIGVGELMAARTALGALDATPGEGEMPTIWEDPAGKGYPCFERPMTPKEAPETIDRYGARICQLEGEGWQDVSTANASAMFGASTWVLVATDRGRVTEGTPFFHDNSGNWIWVCARGSNCSDPRCPSEMLLECVVNWQPLPAAPLSGSVVK